MKLDKRIKELEAHAKDKFDYSRLTDSELHFIVDLFKKAGHPEPGLHAKTLDKSLLTNQEIEEYKRICKKALI
jgi:hypothetical protein